VLDCKIIYMYVYSVDYCKHNGCLTWKPNPPPIHVYLSAVTSVATVQNQQIAKNRIPLSTADPITGIYIHPITGIYIHPITGIYIHPITGLYIHTITLQYKTVNCKPEISFRHFVHFMIKEVQLWAYFEDELA
jgi:hypothetical protein